MTDIKKTHTPENFMTCMKNAEADGRGLKYINRQINCSERYALATPDGMEGKLKDWFKRTEGSDSLFVHGTVGSGKTHSVMALAKLLYVNGIKSRSYNVIEFLNLLKSYFKYDDCEDATSKLLLTSRTLILDDFGAEKQSEWTQEIIYRLINLRYEKILHTIFISNLSTSGIGKVYGDRITSRIIEMVGGKEGIIEISGYDRRLK